MFVCSTHFLFVPAIHFTIKETYLKKRKIICYDWICKELIIGQSTQNMSVHKSLPEGLLYLFLPSQSNE